MSIKEIHSETLASDTDDLEKFCKKQGLKFTQIDLSELPNLTAKCAYIHTGGETNKYNGGNTNHWLLVYADLIFDSYGKYSEYDFQSKDYTYVITNPKQLQTYNTTVCGSYCSMFYHYMEKIYPKESEENGINKDNIGRELGEDFSELYFSNDKLNNDKIAYKWMQEHS